MRRFIRRAGVTVTALVALGVVLPVQQADAAPAAVSVDVQAQQLLTEVNGWRSEAGLKPLELRQDKAISSQRWAETVTDTGNFDHDPWSGWHMQEAGCQWAGEVMAMSGSDSRQTRDEMNGRDAAEMWWNSGGHRDILMTPGATVLVLGVSTADRIWDGRVAGAGFVEMHDKVWVANLAFHCDGIDPRWAQYTPPPGYVAPAPVATPISTTTPFPQVTPTQPTIIVERKKRVVRR